MPIQFDKFDQQKVDRLKNHLDTQAKKGYAKFFEIYVDGLKAVPKTDEVTEFEDYENYMTAETNQIKIVIYNSGLSPRNDQYVFSMKAASPQEALEMGLDGVSLKMLSKTELGDLKASRDRFLAESSTIRDLQEDIEELESELENKRKYINVLEDAVERAKENGNKLGGISLGTILSDGAEHLFRKHAGSIAQIPGLESLAGLIDDGQSKTHHLPDTPSSDSEVTFTKTSDGQPSKDLSEEEKQFLSFFKAIHKKFDDEEICDLIEIMDHLSRDKSKLQPVLDLLETQKH